MKIHSLNLLLLLGSLGVFAQKHEIEVSNFSSFSLGIPANVYLAQGSSDEVIIECSGDDYDKIEIEQKDEALYIRTKNRYWGGNLYKSKIEVFVTMKTIDKLAVSGSGNIKGEGIIDADNLDLKISGSGNMDLDIDSNKIYVKISGSGDVNLGGSTESLNVKISGSGKLKGENMETRIFDASISGSGKCYITVLDELNAKISGSGDVYYKGNPKKVIGNSSGSGKIRKF